MISYMVHQDNETEHTHTHTHNLAHFLINTWYTSVTQQSITQHGTQHTATHYKTLGLPSPLTQQHLQDKTQTEFRPSWPSKTKPRINQNQFQAFW